jgi:hypothetical protein
MVVGSVANLAQAVVWWPMATNGDPIELGEAFDVLMPLIVLGGVGKMIGGWLLLPAWFGIASASLRRLGVVGMTYSPAQAWYSFYLPILNAFRPYTVIRELWHASDPGLVGRQGYDRTGWLTTERTPLLTVFWVAWVASWVLAFLAPFVIWTVGNTMRWILQPFLEAISVAALAFLMVQIERRLVVMKTALSGGPSLRSALGHTPGA